MEEVATLAPPPLAPEGQAQQWLHEAKLDGFRAQIHVEDGEATLLLAGPISVQGDQAVPQLWPYRPVLSAP